MTNFEKYKAELTIDEFARLLLSEGCNKCAYHPCDCGFTPCKDGITLWLEMESNNEQT